MLILMALLSCVVTCDVQFNPSRTTDEVKGAMDAVSEKLVVPVADLRPLMVSRCTDGKTIVQIIRTKENEDELQPWMARRSDGKWEVTRSTE